MSPLSADAARALPGPSWLRAVREAAAERALASTLPTEAEEIWRYSRIGELDLDRYHPADAMTPVSASDEAIRAAIEGTKAIIPAPAAFVMVVDGRVVHHEVDAALAARGVRVGSPDDERSVGEIMTDAPDVYAELNTAFATAPIVIDVPDGVVVEAPVIVSNFAATEGLLTFPRVVVRVGADSRLTVLEHHSSADVAALTLPVAELQVGEAGRLRYLAVNQLGPRAWQVASQVARGAASSSTLVANVALGGDYARVRTDARLDGRAASGDQIAAYFADETQMHDFRTLQDHAAPKTTSDLLFKGAVAGRARSVYSGLIRVRKEAPGTSAFQTNRNLKLSEGAWADSVPNLEIDTNDVRCSHASAVGPVDSEQRFYLESRGVPPERAEELIVNGFFSEVLERLPVPELVPALRSHIADKLSRRDAS
ncbi:MAG TPA: Fe-S cluster assembly protein SufD [Acidimicrobiales bacterium]|nr:Fe-S cluster assembly protein SufD [Acidimicrobiales bacterium]